jgi:hypothetical protein
LLKRLFIENPAWPSFRFAEELTADNRRKNPAAPVVKVATVDSAISRLRQTWEDEEGVHLDKRVQMYEEIAPPPGTLDSAHKSHTLMRYLRHVAREARGEQPEAESEQATRRQALRWAERSRRRKVLVDLTPDGEPIERAARPDELDSQGNLISLAAWKIPGWRQPARV